MWLINEMKKPVSTDGNRKTYREEAKPRVSLFRTQKWIITRFR